MMKPKRIRTQASINRDEWIKLSISPEEIKRRLEEQIIYQLSKELINEVDIVIESNGWVGEGWKVDITVMSTDEYIRLTQELENYKQLALSNPVQHVGGGYDCPQCGKYNRTSVICDHNNDFNRFINKQHNLPPEFGQIISENFDDLI